MARTERLQVQVPFDDLVLALHQRVHAASRKALLLRNAYHDMLLDVSVLRNWWLYAALERSLPRFELSPDYCALPRRVASLALKVHRKLEQVLKALRESAPQLTAGCAVPRRTPSLREYGTRP